MNAALEAIDFLRKVYDEKETQAAALREALQISLDALGCDRVHQDRIEAQEIIHAALAADAGRAMLERVRTLERDLELATRAMRALDEIQKATLGEPLNVPKV